jgi:hypothetical protein
MKINVEITKSDLIRLNLSLIPRMKSTYTTIVAIGIFVFGFLVWLKGFPDTRNHWIAITFGSVGGGIGGMLAGALISFITIALSGTKNNGVLGQHEYEITSEGLFERISANEGLNKWSGINELRISGSYALFQISGYLFHVIPRRSFGSEQNFNEFVKLAKDRWESAHNK